MPQLDLKAVGIRCRLAIPRVFLVTAEECGFLTQSACLCEASRGTRLDCGIHKGSAYTLRHFPESAVLRSISLTLLFSMTLQNEEARVQMSSLETDILQEM